MPGSSRSSSRTRAPSGAARGHGPGRGGAAPAAGRGTGRDNAHGAAIAGNGHVAAEQAHAGWALQALDDGSLPDLLDRVDDATGERVIGAIQRTSGNRSVQRIILNDGLQPGEKAEASPPPTVPTVDPAPSPEKAKSTLDKIKEMVGEKEGEGYTWVGPINEAELGVLWSSFGTGITAVYDANPTLWQRSIERGMEMSDMPVHNVADRMLAEDVKGIAREYVKKNAEDIAKAQKEMGFDDDTKPPTTDQVEKQKDLEWAAVQMQELQKAKERIEQTYTGWAKYGDTPVPANDPDFVYPVPFVPGAPPPLAPADKERPRPDDMPMVPYQEVMDQWKPVSGALLALADEYPALFVGIKEGKLGQLAGDDASDDPVGAAKASLAGVAASIKSTAANVESGDLDWHDLHPIHRQLMEGERAGKLPWNHPVYKEMLKEDIGDYQTMKSVGEFGIGMLAAVAFIFAEIASGGAATAFLIGGLGISGGQTAAKWASWSELKDAANSAASSKTELVDADQVDAALLEAVLQSAFTALDAWQGLKAGGKILAGYRASRAGAKAASLEGLEAVAKAAGKGAASPESLQLVEKAVVEIGVEDTMARMGVKDPLAMLKFVPEGSAAASRISAFAALVEKGVGKGVELPAVLADIGKEVAERGLTETDQLVQLAVERYGPLKTVQMSGGWKNLASALGTDSAAGKVILSWRDSIYADLKAYVEQQMEAAVKETGTIGSFTNDLDMSFLGKDAAANRARALEFLSGRAGLPPNAGALDKMLYIGLFTDPRRMHLFDKFPELAGDLAKKTASFEEQLIWNAELKRVAANTARHQRVLDAMEEFGIKVIDDFKPMSERAADILAAEQDKIAGEIEELALRDAPDKAALAQKLEQMANTQAQINVKEGGGYFSGGGVRRFVTEDPKSPFPGFRPGEAPLKQGTEAYTAALDQVAKLRDAADKMAEAALLGPAGVDELAAALKSLAKYGDRFSQAAQTLGKDVPGGTLFHAMSAEFDRILGMARGQVDITLQAALKEDMAKLVQQAEGALAQFDAIHIEVLRGLRVQAGLVGREVVAADVVKATMSRYRWMRFRSMVMAELGSAGRLIDTAVTAGVDAATDPGARPKKKQKPAADAAP